MFRAEATARLFAPHLIAATFIWSGRRDSNSLRQDGILVLCRVSYCRVRRRPDGTAAGWGCPAGGAPLPIGLGAGFSLLGACPRPRLRSMQGPWPRFCLERQEGLEPTSSAWKAEALPVELLPLLVAAELRAADPCGGDVLAVGLAFPVHCPDMCCSCGPRDAVSGCGSLLPAPAWWGLVAARWLVAGPCLSRQVRRCAGEQQLFGYVLARLVG